MKIAFDARCFTRSLDSIDRVLRVLALAAESAGWDYEFWVDGELRHDAKIYRSRCRSMLAESRTNIDMMWSPEMSCFPIAQPSVATLHDVNPLLPDGRNALSRYWRIRKYSRRVHQTLDHLQALVTDTEDARIRVGEAFTKARPLLSVVPLFVDPRIRPIVGEKGAALLSPFGLSPGYLLFVGSMRRHKNWNGLMQGYARLPKALQIAHPLVFVGRCKRVRKAAVELAEQLDIHQSIHITGVVDESTLHAFYGGARLLVCPSFMEGFGFPALEALACGVPVVASSRTCIPEVLGAAARYVDPSSPQSIAEGLEQVLEDNTLRDRLIESGFTQAASYSPERTAAAMLRVVERVLRETN